MRGVNDDSLVMAIQTAAENRGGQYSSSQKRRWGSCFSISWCFGSQKPSKRIGHVVPDPCSSRPDPPTTSNMSQQPSRVLPFIAPPSSPASFLHSEPPSVSHSPGGFLSFTSVSAHMYSPNGPTNIFAIGPYAHETQLVSPPVFSTYTTEPSTAPFTPPPESVHMTTPSSPEVPYARLLESSNQNNVIPYEFQSYQLYPGSPMGQLLSPSSGFSNSGTSSPCGPHFLQFPTSGKVSPCPWEPQLGGRTEDPQHFYDHRVSFEVTPEQVVRCVERKRSADVANNHQKHRSTTTLGSVKEFNFDSTDGPESDWWANEKVIGRDNGSIKNWSFFPMMQPGVS